MAKRQSKFLLQQKIAVGVGVAIVIAVIGYLITMVIRDSAPLGNYVEGEHYTLLESPQRIRGDKIEVIEFFSYACIHCYRFDPALEDWVESNRDKVKFSRNPVAANDTWQRLARHYFTLEAIDALDQKHLAFFRAVHDAQMNTTRRNLIEWAEDQDLAGYLEAYESEEVRRKTARADQTARRLKIGAVPTVVVHGKYVVRVSDRVGPTRMLEIMDFLVDKEITANATTASETVPQT